MLEVISLSGGFASLAFGFTSAIITAMHDTRFTKELIGVLFHKTGGRASRVGKMFR